MKDSISVVWIHPSSPYPRIQFILVTLSFSISIALGLTMRESCIYFGGFNAPLSNANMVLTLINTIVMLVPVEFISLFVWHFAYNLGGTSNTPLIESGSSSNNLSGSQHFDLSSLSGLRMMIIDIWRTFKPQWKCTSGSARNAVVPLDECLETESCSDSNDNSENNDWSMYETTISNSPYFSVDVAESAISFDKTHPVLPVVDHKTNMQLGFSKSVTTLPSLSVVSRVTILSRKIFTWLAFPLKRMLSPQSIYGVVLLKQPIDCTIALFVVVPPNLHTQPYLRPVSTWLDLLIEKIFGQGQAWMFLAPVAQIALMVSEFALQPVLYRKQSHVHDKIESESSEGKLTVSSRGSRSLLWLTGVVVFAVLVLPVIEKYDTNESQYCWILCEHLQILGNFVMVIWPQTIFGQNSTSADSIVAYQPFFVCIGLFVLVLFTLIIDQRRHFSTHASTASKHGFTHSQCSCRVQYVMLLAMLLSHESGIREIVQSIGQFMSQAYHDDADSIVPIVCFYSLTILWQYVVRWIAFRALNQSSALAVLFPIQLIEDVFSDFMFANLEPFSVHFFVFALFQTFKVIVRDLDCLYLAVIWLVNRLRSEKLQREKQCISSDRMWKQRWFNSAVTRHQNFVLELCVKFIVIAVLTSDAIPLGNHPQWMPLWDDEFSTISSTDKWAFARLPIIASMVFLMSVQCIQHFILLKVIDRFSVSRHFHRHGQSSDSQHIPSDQEISDAVRLTEATQTHMNEHWSRHFLFFVACIIRLVPLVLLYLSQMLAIQPSQDNSPLRETACIWPWLATWTNIASITPSG